MADVSRNLAKDSSRSTDGRPQLNVRYVNEMRAQATLPTTVFCAAVLATMLAASFVGYAAAQMLPADAVADRIVVEKAARRLSLYRRNRLLKTYSIALGRDPKGHKQREGDGRTPEGVYRIDSRKRNSTFHRALHISYPNAEDRRRARERGASPGGAIMIHGLPRGLAAVGKSHLLRDWTEGCIAVTNAEIEEIWRVVPNGTPIEIRP
jgi:murein L,D-transpeptidase YafK